MQQGPVSRTSTGTAQAGRAWDRLIDLRWMLIIPKAQGPVPAGSRLLARAKDLQKDTPTAVPLRRSYALASAPIRGTSTPRAAWRRELMVCTDAQCLWVVARAREHTSHAAKADCHPHTTQPE